MTTNVIRQRLLNYLAEAGEKKIKALYALLQEEIECQSSFQLTEEHLKILDEERTKYQKGIGKSYTWEEAKQLIRK